MKRTTRVVRSLRGGQITIPADFREELGIQADTLLQVTLAEGELRIRPLEALTFAGSPWLKELYDTFGPVREDNERFTEEEIDSAIDEAVAAVRRRRA